MLEIYAGKTAFARIQEQGFKQELFSTFLGASGGPKWFVLFGLDKYLFGEFFKDRTEPLNMLGSSAGAFRAACFGQKDPVAAISKLAKHYSETIYSQNAKADEVTQKAIELLDIVFPDDKQQEIIDNPIFKAHFIVAKSKGLTASDNKLLQLTGLTGSYLLNRLNRGLLKHQYERYIYQPADSKLDVTDSYRFPTHRIDFTANNLQQALLASGSIPIVMTGIKNIPQSPHGMYRDGGIIDYHFDLKINNPGLVLYPHFNANPKAGWFDKNLTRKVSPDNYDNVVLICPSQKFIQTLPYQKIPDRTDFTRMDADTRIQYWHQVLTNTEQLAESFHQFLLKPDCIELKPIYN